MKYFILMITMCIAFIANAQNYPTTKKTPKTITKHGITYTDDYGWLENLQDKETATWIDAQNELFYGHVKEINTVKAITKKITEYDAGSSYPLPRKRGRYYYVRVRTSPDKPALLHYMDKPDGLPQPLPNTLEGYDSKAHLANYYPSDNTKWLALAISLEGGDRKEIRFIDMEKKKISKEVITGTKSGVDWKKDEGVFYKHTSSTSSVAADSTFQLRYHALGTPQNEDRVIFDSSDTGNPFVFGVNDGYLFITEEINRGASKNYYYLHIDSLEKKPVKFIADASVDFNFKYYHNGRFYYSTQQYDWGEMRSRNLDGSGEKVVIPQFFNQLLVSTLMFDDYMVCKYKTPGKLHLSIYDKDINFIRKYDLPPGHDCTVYYYDDQTKCLYMSISSYTLSAQNYTLNLETGEFKLFFSRVYKPKPTLFPLDYFESKTVIYKSRDGKDVPITIVHKKGLSLDGNNPTLLMAYGGFGVVSTPTYNTGLLYFLEQGGVFAYAEVRGGGEKGLKWHAGGRGRNKMNSINDVVDAAQFLITEKYTTSARLAFIGGSHGGLLATGAMIQKPELFRVVVSTVGLTDVPMAMQNTIGNSHKDEFGDVGIKEDYTYMLSYSPYQNVKEDINYPITLLVTGENDDRLPPFQSYKFAALLQNRPAQKNPVYLKTISKAGHSGSTNYKASTNDDAELYSFLLYHLRK